MTRKDLKFSPKFNIKENNLKIHLKAEFNIPADPRFGSEELFAKEKFGIQ